jgi:hypothetical protein
VHFAQIPADDQVLSARGLTAAVVVVVLALAGGFIIGRAMRTDASRDLARVAEPLPAPAPAPRVSAPAPMREVPSLRGERTNASRQGGKVTPSSPQGSPSPSGPSQQQPSGSEDEPVSGGF